MARPREFDDKYVLDALQDVFWEYGYEGTSYAHIMKATGLKKGSLYAAFGDKRALYLKALAQYDLNYVSQGLAMLADNSLSPRMRVENLMQGLVDGAQTPRGRWGCMLCNAAIDQAPFDSDTEKSVKRSIEQMRKAIEKVLVGTNAEGRADIIWAAYFGGRVVVKAGISKARLKEIKAQVIGLL